LNCRISHIQNWPELAQQAKWSASALAKQCGISLRTLERFFLTKMDKRPKVWLSEERQRLAVELLQRGYTVKETAGFLNYRHPSHFTNGFKKRSGYCPTKRKFVGM
jgi:AraC-like DNA-binding protein